MDEPGKKLDPDLARLFACRLMWEETQDPTALIEALGWLRPRLPSWLESSLVGVLEASRYDDRERHAVRWMSVCHFKTPDVSWDDAAWLAVESLKGHWAEAGFEMMKKSYAVVQRDLKNGRLHLYQIWRDRHLAPIEPQTHKAITEREGIAMLRRRQIAELRRRQNERAAREVKQQTREKAARLARRGI
jgi:hypothetical protein